MQTIIDREDWLKQRRELITASDVYKILFGSALEVYEQKVTGYSMADNQQLMFGRLMEGPVAEIYKIKTEREVRDLGATEIQIHPDIPWLGATLDRWQKVYTRDGSWSGPLEIKTAMGRKAAEWTDEEAPVENECQLQIQMACTGATRGTLCGMLWGNANLKYIDKEREDSFLEEAFPELEEFYLRVQRKDPPPARSEACLPALKRLYPSDNGETVSMGADVQAAVESLEKAKKDRRDVEKRVKALEAEIRGAIGAAEWGALPDGRFLRLPTYHRTGYTVEATDYRQLRIVKTR